MPTTTSLDLQLNRVGGDGSPAAAHRDHYERCEALRHELGLTVRGLRVALYLLESPQHTIALGELGRGGGANQALGCRGYDRVFRRRVEYGEKPGLRKTWLELTEDARTTIERAMGCSD